MNSAVSVALAGAPGQRRRLVGVGVAVAVSAVVVVAIALAGVGGGRSWIGRSLLLVVAGALVALSATLLRAAAEPPGSLRAGPDGIVIVNRALLRQPVVVPRRAVRTLLVDDVDRPDEGLPAELAPRFSLVEPGDRPAWLHPAARSALPYLGWAREAPNGVLVLRGPYRLGRAPRRVVAMVLGNEELRVLATCGGFFFGLAVPDAAAAQVSSTGLDQPLTLAEAAELDTFASERRWFRRAS